jgi:hypothetical protein
MELNKYNQGDIVYHKASGQKGVIEKILYLCSDIEHHITPQYCKNNLKCNTEFSGSYKVSIGYEQSITTEEYLLTLVPPDLKPTASDDAARTKLKGGEGL